MKFVNPLCVCHYNNRNAAFHQIQQLKQLNPQTFYRNLSDREISLSSVYQFLVKLITYHIQQLQTTNNPTPKHKPTLYLGVKEIC